MCVIQLYLHLLIMVGLACERGRVVKINHFINLGCHKSSTALQNSCGLKSFIYLFIPSNVKNVSSATIIIASLANLVTEYYCPEDEIMQTSLHIINSFLHPLLNASPCQYPVLPHHWLTYPLHSVTQPPMLLLTTWWLTLLSHST